ncbi:MAG TPA: hypothetical protein VKB19_19405 [Pedobacter sp.]|nr:hypothetical protein [Pedobacter sp.]
MKNLTYITTIAAAFLLFISSCKKDEVIDGGLSNEKVNMSTYDYLQSHPRRMFDTTLLIIDKAGMRDLINGPGTFFVPNDYAIANYLATRQREVRENDERNNFTLDSLMKYTPQMLRDSMGMYFFPERITRDVLNSTGKDYQTSTAGISLNIVLEERNEYQQDGVITTKPKYIYLVKVNGEKDIFNASDDTHEDPSGEVELEDEMTVCQTTGILTNNGVIHVLANYHSWIFKKLTD